MNISIVGDKCVGCHACEQACPVTCIEFKENQEGFCYPAIKKDKCIDCNKCANICPVLNKPKVNKIKQVYAGWVLKQDIIKKSSSGGVFASFAQSVLSENGKVYGCAYDDKLNPRHIGIDDISELFKLQGSKYAESDIGNIYSEIEKQLKKGEKVLFSGTPCQCAGLRGYLGKEYDNLIVIDIICHGVPSRKLFKSYIRFLECKKRGRLVSFDFRNKDKHGWSLTYKYKIVKRKRIKEYQGIASLSSYYYGFLAGFMYRQSCYQCPFANPNRISDITLGDYWGIEKIDPDNNNYQGVSAIIVNTETGKRLLEKVSGEVQLAESTFEKVSIQNSNLLHPTSKNQLREVIYTEYQKYGYEYIAKKYLRTPHYCLELVKSAIPNDKRQKIKKIIKRK